MQVNFLDPLNLEMGQCKCVETFKKDQITFLHPTFAVELIRLS